MLRCTIFGSTWASALVKNQFWFGSIFSLIYGLNRESSISVKQFFPFWEAEAHWLQADSWYFMTSGTGVGEFFLHLFEVETNDFLAFITAATVQLGVSGFLSLPLWDAI